MRSEIDQIVRMDEGRADVPSLPKLPEFSDIVLIKTEREKPPEMETWKPILIFFATIYTAEHG